MLAAAVIARTDWAEGLCSLTLDAAPSTFEPGQFINLGLRLDGAIVRRPYSIASPPGAPIELYLVRVDDGVLSPHLCALQVGDRVLVERQPSGLFTLRYVPRARDGWLLATGTGLGPLLSMMRSGQLFHHFDHVVLAHGVRHNAHLGYRSEIERLARTHHGQLHYLPLVSRQAPEHGLAGRIPAALRDGRLERAAGRSLEPGQAQVLLCGNPAMIADTTAALAERGLRRHRVRRPGHISTEEYW